MPRRPSEEARTEWKVSISATTAARVELHIFDPVLKKPRYAERSKLIERLLIEWLAKQSNPLTSDDPVVEKL